MKNFNDYSICKKIDLGIPIPKDWVSSSIIPPDSEEDILGRLLLQEETPDKAPCPHFKSGIVNHLIICNYL
jgi:hypothetical protein